MSEPNFNSIACPDAGSAGRLFKPADSPAVSLPLPAGKHANAFGALSMEARSREFLQMLTHDMRTPLTSVRGFFQLLEAGAFGELSQQSKTAAGRAHRNLNEAIQMISDLLDIDQIESAGLSISPSSTTTQLLFRGAVERLACLARSKSIALEYETSYIEIMIDVSLMQRVLTNIVANAIKFSPAGRKVVIRSFVSGGQATIEVIDQGRGIPESEQAYVFEPFRHAHSADNYGLGSSGLGLAICKKLVEAHGGSIGLKSKEGNGTTFWFTVPLCSAVQCRDMPVLEIRKPKHSKLDKAG